MYAPSSLPATAGRGDRAFARWEGRRHLRTFNYASEALPHTPPPPHFVRSPSPACAGADEFDHSRGAPLRPSYATQLSEIVTTGLDPVVHTDVTPTSTGGKHCVSEASAWMPGSSPGMTKGTNGKERKKMSEAKRRQTQWVFCRGVGHGRACIGRRTSIGVPPRFSPQGVFHRKGLSLRPCFLGPGLFV